ncbi:TatD family hydrolase [Flavobacterium sp. 25HG05S-40]|uniref:TatD family hydrolase n=1 Tax=Flavobacterium sp. 25HG05S-40 TaxID=3458682 RepID=UPI0040447E7E
MPCYNLHTHKVTQDADTVALVNQYPWEFDASIPLYSIGIHPWYISKERLESDLKLIEEKLALKECLALGECGLDKRIEVPMALQIEVYEKQIDLSEKYQKPLVLHLVAAFDELLALKKQKNISVPMIIHGFSKNEQVAQQLLDAGFYLSFGKYLLRNPELKEVFQSIPNDRFFLETDTIEESLNEVYALAADYKMMSMTEMKSTVAANWNHVFGI